MSLIAVYETVFPVIATYTAYPIIWPNVTPKVQPTGTHIEAYVMPTDSESLGVTGVDFDSGYLQFLVRVKQGSGSIAAAEIAAAIGAKFPRGLALTHAATGQIVRFDKAPSYKPALQDGAWFSVPVLVKYRVTL